MKSEDFEKGLEARRNRTDMERVRAMRDSEIDCTETPETDEKFWEDAELVLHMDEGHILLLGEFLKLFAFSTLSYAFPFKATPFHTWTGQESGQIEPQMIPYGVAATR